MNNQKTIAELDEIMIEVINLLADKGVSVNDARYISENIPTILEVETKVKRID